jgi:hypothetical protein
MTRLLWSVVGERFYESGVDQGILYIDGIPPVPWNGLTAVRESPTGSEAQPYYIDGYKYLNLSGNEEFTATLEAYTSPKEFDLCDGNGSIGTGVYVTQQARKSFNFSYRTLIGNDLEGLGFGYKLHIVYNALAKPTNKGYESLNDSSDPLSLSWTISTLPPSFTGYKPTAHFVIDSRTTPELLLSYVEDILYGSDSVDPRLPSAAELIDIFIQGVDLEVVVPGDGTYSAEGLAVVMTAPGTFTIDHSSVVDNGDGSFSIM